MTVSTTVTQNTFSGDGSTVTFPFTFFCLFNSWVTCFLSNISTGAFTVTLNTDQSASPGGTVTFTTAPPAGSANVLIKRSTPQTQLTNYTEYNPFPALSHMSALDQLTAEVQDLAASISSQAIPPLVAGDVLSNDGTNLLWVPQSGGGGGGVDIIGPPAAALAYGAEITGAGAVLQLGIADVANPGMVVPNAQQAFSGLKTNADDFAGKNDIRTYGAVNGGTLIANDAAAVLNAMLADGLDQADIPPGVFLCGQPILVSSPFQYNGRGSRVSTLKISTTPPDGTHIPAFAGILLFPTGGGLYTPGYGASLIAGTTQSLNVWSGATHQNAGTTLYLHAAGVWSNLSGLSAWCGQGWINVTSVDGGIGTVMQSAGWLTSGASFNTGAFKFDVMDGGAGPYLAGQLTTSTGVHTWTTAANSIVYGTTAHVEWDYNGAFLDVYINGVNVVHSAVTGAIVQQPWEAVNIGAELTLGPQSGQIIYNAANCQLGGWRFSNIVRHTGTGSFTPPTSAYAWDANTLALWNLDQGNPTFEPWVILQAQCPGSVLPMKHYAHQLTGNFTQGPIGISGLQLDCSSMGMGLISSGAPFSTPDDVLVVNPNKVGIGVYGGESYAWRSGPLMSISCLNGVGIDLWSATGACHSIMDQYSAIGCSVTGMTIGAIVIQPSGNVIVPVRFTSGGGALESLEISGLTIDFELLVQNCLAGIVLDNTISNIKVKTSNVTAFAFRGTTLPCVLCDGSPLSAIFENCFFDQDALPNRQIFKKTTAEAKQFVGPITVKNSQLGPIGNGPWSLSPNFVVQDQATQRNNIVGLSTSDELANNISGTFNLLDPFTSAQVRFLNEEPDGNYQVICFPQVSNGGTPAVNSLIPTSFTTSKEGFTVNFKVAPGSGIQNTYVYFLLRTYGPPLAFEYTPGAGSFTNPLAGQTGDWAAGVTIKPASGNVFIYDSAYTTTTILESGTTPGTNFWEFALINGGAGGGGGLTAGANAVGLALDSYIADGQLVGVMNPGTHNMALYSESGQLSLYLDGTTRLVGTSGPLTQASLIYTAQRWNGSQPLSGVATLRNVKIATRLDQVITTEADSGPGTQAQAAFFGDDFTLGYVTTTGGFASQLAENRYGTTYYWLAAAYELQVTNNTTTGTIGLKDTFWAPWGSGQTDFAAIFVMCGIYDLLNAGTPGAPPVGSAAADIWAVLETIFIGGPSTATWAPPTLNTHAWAGYVAPTSGTATCVIDGISFACPFTTDSQTTIANLITLVSANATITSLVTLASITQSPGDYFMAITAIAPGASGNGISVSTDGANGARWYTGPFNVGTTYGGADTTITINGITLVTNFTTNATNTVNAAIAAIAGNGTLNALVTGSLVAGQMLLTANNPGLAGNAITIECTSPEDPFSGDQTLSFWVTPPLVSGVPGTMVGGYNGSIQTSIPAYLCNIPPFGNDSQYTAPKDAQRTSLNATIASFCSAHPGLMTLVDIDGTVRDPAAHQNILASYLAADNLHLNNAGHAAVYSLITAFLP
jgi:hypothetical protein